MHKKEIKYYVLVGIIAFIVSLTCNSFTNQFFYTDSSVFQYVATEMQHGGVPYLDTFDHKGPLIYVINFLGLSISHAFGLWLFEFAAIIVSFLYFYRIARLCTQPLPSLFVVGISSIALYGYLEGGNFTELYALPFVTISLYIFLQYFITGKTKNRSVFLCGICFGGVLLLRPNMIAVWIAGCFFVLIDCIKKKTYSVLPKFILCFVLGTGIFVIPFAVWLYMKGALQSAIDTYLVFNFKYSDSAMSLYSIYTSFDGLLFKYIPLLSVLGILMMVFYDRTIKTVMIASAWILSAIFIVMPGRIYGHYAVIFIPYVIYPIAYLLSWFSESCIRKTKAVALFFAILVSIGIMPSAVSFAQSVRSSISRLNTLSEQNPESNSIVKVILERTEPEDEITVFGNEDRYYLLSNRMSASRYSYQSPIGNVDPVIFSEYFKELEENKPKVIVWIQYDWAESDKMSSYIQKHGYIQDEIEECVFYLP